MLKPKMMIEFSDPLSLDDWGRARIRKGVVVFIDDKQGTVKLNVLEGSRSMNLIIKKNQILKILNNH